VAGLPSPSDINGCDTKTRSEQPSKAAVNPRDCRTFEVVQRDDGEFAIGWHDEAAGPFPSRRFAESVAARLVVAA
jgi:hypothetical protein